MTQINMPNIYPVDLDPPDISEYAPGNTGIPYIWRFDSGVPGPNVMLSAIVHGNEPCGAIALDWILRSEVKFLSGTCTFAFMNIAAYEAFDRADPNASRWVDEDFNRVWDTSTLDGDRDSIELRRAREVRPALADIDYMLDLHTMQHLAPPVMMCGRHKRGMDLAARVGLPERVIADSGHAAGRRMRDYAAFDDPDSSATALLIECGQHWETSAGILAKQSAARFLEILGVIGPELSASIETTPAPQRFYTVTQPVTIQTDDFRFAEPFRGGEVIPKAGTVIGYDGETPVTTNEDNMMLVMPSRRLWKGQTAVRLARQERQSAV